MILSFDLKKAGQRGRPKHVTEEVYDFEEARKVIRKTLKAKGVSISNIVLKSKALV